jgi:hypothetical protein
MKNENEAPLTLKGDRTTGRLDIGLFRMSDKPDLRTFFGTIEVKRLIRNGTECAYDADRIREISNLSNIYGIVAAPFVSEKIEEVRRLLCDAIHVDISNTIFDSSVLNRDGNKYTYGFIGAAICFPPSDAGLPYRAGVTR